MPERARASRRTTALRGLTYKSEILVRFAHCDPAGIVFFPRYLEMFNNLVEDWCRDELGISFAEIPQGRGWGIPTVHLEVDFLAPSRVGDTLAATLVVRAIGKTSIRLGIVLRGPDGSDRVRAEQVIVLLDPRHHRATSIPDDLRQRLDVFRAEE